MYLISGFKDGRNYCLEIKTPYERKFHVFPTYGGYQEYIDNFLWHLRMSNKEYKVEVMD